MGIHPGIEQAALADGAIGQFGGQGPIGAGQRLAVQFPLQGGIGVGTGRHRQQHLPGHIPGRQAVGSHGVRQGGSPAAERARSEQAPDVLEHRAASDGVPAAGAHDHPPRSPRRSAAAAESSRSLPDQGSA